MSAQHTTNVVQLAEIALVSEPLESSKHQPRCEIPPKGRLNAGGFSKGLDFFDARKIIIEMPTHCTTGAVIVPALVMAQQRGIL